MEQTAKMPQTEAEMLAERERLEAETRRVLDELKAANDRSDKVWEAIDLATERTERIWAEIRQMADDRQSVNS